MRKTPFYILLFMFSIIGALTAVCAVYPADGLQIGSFTLRFPTLAEMLAPDGEEETRPTLSPEEILLQREREMRIQQENEILQFFRENIAAIRFPRAITDSTSIGDSTYFDAFFAALEGADTTHVNIVHYGDSQIEEDRITNILRRNLQADFTGGGIGLLPAYQSVQTQTIQQAMSYQPTRSIVYNTYQPRKDKQYGPIGQMAWIDSTYTLSIAPRNKNTGLYSAHYFSQVTILSSAEHNMRIKVHNERKTIENKGKSLQLTTFTLPDSTTRASIQFMGQGHVYGIWFGNPTGVNVDNIPMRGCSGTIFTRIDASQLRTYFAATHTRLIILQYGGNRMPHFYSSKGIDEYVSSLRKQIAYLQHLAPEATFLFIGPSDMSTRKNGKMITYPLLPEVNDKLSTMARDAGIAYWSMYDAMGGKNSMQQWVKSGLAGKDYIHFTRRGANEMGKMLYEELMTVYRYYQWRIHNPKEPVKEIPLLTPLVSLNDSNSLFLR